MVVPSAALRTAADGTVTVITADGTQVPVTQLASARGLSVVDGVMEGMQLRIPASIEAK